MNILVSACLMGVSCRYDGKSNLLPQLEYLMKHHTCIPVCAELFGGLPIPRIPAERQGEQIITKDGRDVTDAYLRGAEEVVRLAKLYRCSAALLKENSPACGSGSIYDGTFTHTLISGDGVAAQKLREQNIAIYGESQIEQLLRDEIDSL